MKELLQTLNSKVVINDLIVRRMKYEISMLFYDKPTKERANILAKKIHTQLDKSLEGVDEKDKDAIRRLLLINSFLVIPNPASDNINYGHVLTTLTNYDENDVETKDRLTKWLDNYTDVTYDEESLTQYIKSYKIKASGKVVKTAASTYEPSYEKAKLEDINRPPQAPIDEALYRYRPTRRAFIVPVIILLMILLYSFFHFELHEKPRNDMEFITPESYDDSLELTIPDELKHVRKVNIRIIPEEYRYKEMNLKSIFTYLEEKNSMLTQKDYLTTITELSEKYYVNPILLIAIIGQEQGFVPMDHEYAESIINNPYNVFGSWQDYNTDFREATIICLNTITTALENRPEDADLIVFLNDKYSEDENWHKGVTIIFQTLSALE